MDCQVCELERATLTCLDCTSDKHICLECDGDVHCGSSGSHARVPFGTQPNQKLQVAVPPTSKPKPKPNPETKEIHSPDLPKVTQGKTPKSSSSQISNPETEPEITTGISPEGKAKPNNVLDPHKTPHTESQPKPYAVELGPGIEPEPEPEPESEPEPEPEPGPEHPGPEHPGEPMLKPEANRKPESKPEAPHARDFDGDYTLDDDDDDDDLDFNAFEEPKPSNHPMPEPKPDSNTEIETKSTPNENPKSTQNPNPNSSEPQSQVLTNPTSSLKSTSSESKHQQNTTYPQHIQDSTGLPNEAQSPNQHETEAAANSNSVSLLHPSSDPEHGNKLLLGMIRDSPTSSAQPSPSNHQNHNNNHNNDHNNKNTHKHINKHTHEPTSQSKVTTFSSLNLSKALALEALNHADHPYTTPNKTTARKTAWADPGEVGRNGDEADGDGLMTCRSSKTPSKRSSKCSSKHSPSHSPRHSSRISRISRTSRTSQASPRSARGPARSSRSARYLSQTHKRKKKCKSDPKVFARLLQPKSKHETLKSKIYGEFLFSPRINSESNRILQSSGRPTFHQRVDEVIKHYHTLPNRLKKKEKNWSFTPRVNLDQFRDKLSGRGTLLDRLETDLKSKKKRLLEKEKKVLAQFPFKPHLTYKNFQKKMRKKVAGNAGFLARVELDMKRRKSNLENLLTQKQAKDLALFHPTPTVVNNYAYKKKGGFMTRMERDHETRIRRKKNIARILRRPPKKKHSEELKRIEEALKC